MNRLTGAKLLMIVAVVLVMFISSCANVSNSHVSGIWGTNKGSVMVTNLSATSKEGRATCESIIGFVQGDCSIEAAKKDGNIAEVSTVDYEATRYWQFYAKYTTIVTGR